MTGNGRSLWPQALDLLNPTGTLPALAITYDQDAIDILLVVSLAEPQLEREGAYDMNFEQWPLETRRLAKLNVGHRSDNEGLPQILLDPERHAHGNFFIVRDKSVIRVVVPWIRRLEDLGESCFEVRSLVDWNAAREIDR